MTRESGAIALEGILARAATTVDGGWRLSFDVPQSQVNEVMLLSAMRDLALQLVVMPLEMVKSQDQSAGDEI